MSQAPKVAGNPYGAELAAAKKAVSLASRLCQVTWFSHRSHSVFRRSLPGSDFEYISYESNDSSRQEDIAKFKHGVPFSFPTLVELCIEAKEAEPVDHLLGLLYFSLVMNVIEP